MRRNHHKSLGRSPMSFDDFDGIQRCRFYLSKWFLKQGDSGDLEMRQQLPVIKKIVVPELCAGTQPSSQISDGRD